jgi:hypothetical protein
MTTSLPPASSPVSHPRFGKLMVSWIRSNLRELRAAYQLGHQLSREAQQHFRYKHFDLS